MDDERLDFTIRDIENYLKQSLEEVREPWDACQHKQVMLDHQAHTVTCKVCNKQLDPFWYLCLLAKEWRTRSYQDQAAREAWEKMRQRDIQDRAKGHHFSRPPRPGPAQEAWDTFFDFYGKAPHSIYYSCKEWRACADETSSESTGYLRKRLAERRKQNDQPTIGLEGRG